MKQEREELKTQVKGEQTRAVAATKACARLAPLTALQRFSSRVQDDAPRVWACAGGCGARRACVRGGCAPTAARVRQR